MLATFNLKIILVLLSIACMPGYSYALKFFPIAGALEAHLGKEIMSVTEVFHFNGGIVPGRRISHDITGLTAHVYWTSPVVGVADDWAVGVGLGLYMLGGNEAVPSADQAFRDPHGFEAPEATRAEMVNFPLFATLNYGTFANPEPDLPFGVIAGFGIVRYNAVNYDISYTLPAGMAELGVQIFQGDGQIGMLTVRLIQPFDVFEPETGIEVENQNFSVGFGIVFQ